MGGGGEGLKGLDFINSTQTMYNQPNNQSPIEKKTVKIKTTIISDLIYQFSLGNKGRRKFTGKNYHMNEE